MPTTKSRPLQVLRDSLQHEASLKAPWLVCYSGGLDSGCLLHAFVALCGAASVKALYFNHGLRSSQECESEARTVQDFCQALGVELIQDTAPPGALSKRSDAGGQGLEAAAREARYGFFERVQKVHGGTLVTAHHRRDQAETFLMRLFWGKKLRGLGGIPERSGALWRPWLTLSPPEIQAYGRENAVPFWTDSTNVQTDFLRNKIRHQILPTVHEIFPQAEESLSQWTQDFADWLAHLAQRQAGLWTEIPEGYRISREVFDSLADLEIVYSLLSLCQSRDPGSGALVQEVKRIRREISWKAENDNFQIQGGERWVFCRRKVVISQVIGYFKKVRLDEIFLMGPWEIKFSSQLEEDWNFVYPLFPRSLEDELVLRNRNSWDQRPFGADKRSFKKIFQDLGIPEADREKVPLVMDKTRILAVLAEPYGYKNWILRDQETTNQLFIHMNKMEQ